MNALNLTQTFPRSPGEVLGGFATLPRIIDKCRAVIAGTNGDYHFNCPLDQRFFAFTKIDAEQFKSFVAQGKDDSEIQAWVQDKTRHLSETDIAAWSYDQRARTPQNAEEKAFFEQYRQKFCPKAPHAKTWFEMLDAEERRL